MNHWKNKNVVAAVSIAVIADLIQFPLVAAQATVVLAAPAEIADVLMDFIVMFAISRLIGFHWLLLPSLFVEFIPGLDLIPTWTGCVLFLVHRQNQQSLKSAVVDVQELKTISPPPLLPTERKFSVSEVEVIPPRQIPLKSADAVGENYEAKQKTYLTGGI